MQLRARFLSQAASFWRSQHLPALLARSGGVLAVAGFAESAFRFSRNVILARLLLPGAFGLVAIMNSSSALTEALTEMGLREVVVQSKRSREAEFLNAVWWVAAIRGVLLYAALFLAAPWTAGFFKHPEAVSLLRVGFLTTLVNGLANPQLHVLQKDFAFGKWALLVQASGAAGVVVAVVAGFLTHSVWALVAGFLTEAILKCVLSFVFLPFRPRLGPTRECMSQVFAFSKGFFGLPILTAMVIHSDTFVIGKILSTETLGLYYLAKELADAPNKVLSRVVTPLLLPLFSSRQDDLRGIRSHMVHASQVILTLGLPYVVFCCCFGDSFLAVVYGPRVAAMWAPFGVLSLAILFYILSTVFGSVFFALGRPHTQRFATVVRVLVLITLIYPLCRSLGVVGVALSVGLSMLVGNTVQLQQAHRVLGLTAREYFAESFPTLVYAGLAAATAIPVRLLGMQPAPAMAFGALACGAACAAGLIRLPLVGKARAAWFQAACVK